MATHVGIKSDEVYRWAVFLAAVGFGEKAGRVARQRGLRVMKTGKGVFVRGADWLAYLEQQNAKPADAADTREVAHVG